MRTALLNNETIVFTTRQHWVAPVVHSRWAILLVLGSIALGWIEPSPSRTLPSFVTRSLQSIRSCTFLGGGGWIVFNVLAWRAAEYSVSNRRIMGHDGLLTAAAARLLTSVSDVRTARSMLGRALGYGNLHIVLVSEAAGEDVFSTVRDADSFQQHAREQMTAAASVPTSVRQPSRTMSCWHNWRCCVMPRHSPRRSTTRRRRTCWLGCGEHASITPSGWCHPSPVPHAVLRGTRSQESHMCAAVRS